MTKEELIIEEETELEDSTSEESKLKKEKGSRSCFEYLYFFQ